MFSFLNASMSGATSRFLTFSLGQGDLTKVNKTFSTALIIHWGIALCIIVLSETIGLWLLENKLVIPEQRMTAARIVYQFSILSVAIQITQVPYNASIISYEKMDAYAYIELLHVLLKLGIVFLLSIGNFDKLILYAGLILVVNIIIAIVYRVYCTNTFKTCKFHWIHDKRLLLPMLSFSGWDLYGNMCYSVRQQGINMLINVFFGVTLNAASSIATSVQGVVASLSANVVQAFRPQIIKQYAQNNIRTMETLMCNSIKFSVLLFAMVGVPLSYEIYPIMQLWLGTVPEFAPQFCVLLLTISLFNTINRVIVTAIHATGRIRYLSLISGTLYLLIIPIVYLLFRYLTNNPLYAYLTSLIIMITIVITNTIIARCQIPGLSLRRIISSFISSLLLGLLASPSLFVSSIANNGFFHIILTFVAYIFSLLVFAYFFAINKEQRNKINNFIISKLSVNKA